jgi:hypothetical protein
VKAVPADRKLIKIEERRQEQTCFEHKITAKKAAILKRLCLVRVSMNILALGMINFYDIQRQASNNHVVTIRAINIDMTC